VYVARVLVVIVPSVGFAVDRRWSSVAASQAAPISTPALDKCYPATAARGLDDNGIHKRLWREEKAMDGQNRKALRPGLRVAIVLKQNQQTGKRTIGVVKDILTSSASHPHGIKVRLHDGQIGRVQEILDGED
jgi:uncharacterized repeat protein (TIGR03833 family)